MCGTFIDQIEIIFVVCIFWLLVFACECLYAIWIVCTLLSFAIIRIFFSFLFFHSTTIVSLSMLISVRLFFCRFGTFQFKQEFPHGQPKVRKYIVAHALDIHIIASPPERTHKKTRKKNDEKKKNGNRNIILEQILGNASKSYGWEENGTRDNDGDNNDDDDRLDKSHTHRVHLFISFYFVLTQAANWRTATDDAVHSNSDSQFFFLYRE